MNTAFDHVVFEIPDLSFRCTHCGASRAMCRTTSVVQASETLADFAADHRDCTGDQEGQPPNIIYLQWYGDVPEGEPLEGLDHDMADVSWAQERIFDADIVYRRVRSPRIPRATYDFRPKEDQILLAIMQRFNLGEAAAIEAIETFDSRKLKGGLKP